MDEYEQMIGSEVTVILIDGTEFDGLQLVGVADPYRATGGQVLVVRDANDVLRTIALYLIKLVSAD